jgi:hypothetical protein
VTLPAFKAFLDSAVVHVADYSALLDAPLTAAILYTLVTVPE